jgi:diaminopimelate epimerase
MELNPMPGRDFRKMHGAGNDFIVAADPDGAWPRDPDSIRHLCDRRRGIGADGLILLSPCPDPGAADLAMAFFNCDGSRAGMCGNGLRCAALFAHLHLGSPGELRIATEAGVLAAAVLPDLARVRIEIPVLVTPRPVAIDPFRGWFVDTGVPHLVIALEGRQLADLDVVATAPPLRHHPRFAPAGCNVDFIAPGRPGDPIPIRTYERGVEAETLACGTGIAAAAVALAAFTDHRPPLAFRTAGGDLLQVDLPQARGIAPGSVSLVGPAAETFAGILP